MFSHTKIKWTIDAEKTEIFFKEKCFVLSGCRNIQQNNHREHYIENTPFYPNSSDNIPGSEKTRELNNIEESKMHVKTIEYLKKMNYNLIVFEEKSTIHFWKRNTYSGLLILNDYNLNVIITLHKKEHDFDINGTASATYFVKGELHKNETDPDSKELQENETMVLNTVLLFEGEIKLVEDEEAN